MNEPTSITTSEAGAIPISSAANAGMAKVNKAINIKINFFITLIF
nr:MAG: hypothetical protein [Bacteriophage sp.]